MDRTPVSGWASAQFLQETRAPRDGFPDRRRRSDDDDDDRGDDRRTGRNPDEPAFLRVDGLARGDLLNLRSEPRVGSQILARLAEGVVLRNEGCRPVGDVSWCRLTTLERDSVTGWASGQFLRASEGPRFGGGTPRPDFREPPRNPDFADGLSGEPDFWEVRGLSRGDTLNVRLAPDGNSRVIARLNEGVVLRNQGCRMNGPTRWCRVETVQGVEVSGWVSGQYLREGRAPR